MSINFCSWLSTSWSSEHILRNLNASEYCIFLVTHGGCDDAGERYLFTLVGFTYRSVVITPLPIVTFTSKNVVVCFAKSGSQVKWMFLWCWSIREKNSKNSSWLPDQRMHMSSKNLLYILRLPFSEPAEIHFPPIFFSYSPRSYYVRAFSWPKNFGPRWPRAQVILQDTNTATQGPKMTIF